MLKTTWFRAVALLALGVVIGAGCKTKKSAPEQAEDAAVAPPPQPKPPQLPPEPAPPQAAKAGEVPKLESELADDAKYQAIWKGDRADLNAFLTYTSELLATGRAPKALHDKLTKKKLQHAAENLFLIHARIARYPADFTKHVAQHLATTEKEQHLGTWAPYKKGGAIHDYTCLAAWIRKTDARYLRELIAAKRDGAGPMGWRSPSELEALRPWMVFERDALKRLALFGELRPDETARLEKLEELAKQPKLRQDFKLGEFTYNVQGVETTSAVGSGMAKKRASEGARFVVVNFTIRNDGSETETVLADDFRIIDAKGREYRPSSEANTALVMSGGKDLGLAELQPGLKRKMQTAFEMPTEAAEGEITLVIPEKGALGTESVRMTLR